MTTDAAPAEAKPEVTENPTENQEEEAPGRSYQGVPLQRVSPARARANAEAARIMREAGAEEPKAEEPKAEPKAEEKAEPKAEEPPKERSLKDIEADYLADKPIPPSELTRLMRQRSQERQQLEAERAASTQYHDAFPKAAEALATELKDTFGIEGEQEKLLNSILDRVLVVGDREGPGLVDVAAEATMGRLVYEQGSELLRLMGGSADASRRVQQMEPEKYIKAAFDLGQKTPTSGFITQEEHEQKLQEALADSAPKPKTLPTGAVNGGAASAREGTWTTKREARILHSQGKIPSQEMRAINANRDIPEGYS